MGMRSAAGFFRRFFRRGVSDRERPAFVPAVFLVGVVESLEKDFLLVRAVLVGLGLWQFRDLRVGHVASGCGAMPENRRFPRASSVRWRTARSRATPAGRAVLISPFTDPGNGTIHALLADEIRARRVLDRRPCRGERAHHAMVRRAQLPGAQ